MPINLLLQLPVGAHNQLRIHLVPAAFSPPSRPHSVGHWSKNNYEWARVGFVERALQVHRMIQRMGNEVTPRERVANLLRAHRWAPVVAVIFCACLFTAVSVWRLSLPWLIVAGAFLAASAYVYGYCAHAFRSFGFPRLARLQRRQYAEVWDALATSSVRARVAACGEQEESDVRRSAERPVGNIMELAMITQQDELLEIGCGVGRIGLELAPRCKYWTGADISANMLTVAAERLAKLSNIRLTQLKRIGLEQFPPDSFDVVYSTNMFDHLDEVDRWLYVRDAFRVLRPGGRLFVDNTDLESEAGWRSFANVANAPSEIAHPPYTPTPATSDEYIAFARRAGFDRVEVHKRAPVLILTAIKPSSKAG